MGRVGRVYCIQWLCGTPVYVGKTINTLKKRLQKHRKNPNSSVMALVLSAHHTIRCLEDNIPLSVLHLRELYWFKKLQKRFQLFNLVRPCSNEPLYKEPKKLKEPKEPELSILNSNQWQGSWERLALFLWQEWFDTMYYLDLAFTPEEIKRTLSFLDVWSHACDQMQPSLTSRLSRIQDIYPGVIHWIRCRVAEQQPYSFDNNICLCGDVGCPWKLSC